MTLNTYDDIAQRSDEWYELRRGILTASAIGTLVTPATKQPANNDTARGLITQLVAERITGWIEPTFTSDAMLRGILDEPLARDLYAEHFGVTVTESGFMVREINGLRLGYSPDGLVGDDGLLEVKSRLPKIQLATILADAVPAANMAQLQCGLLVSGREWIDYVSYCGGMPLYVTRVTPDPEWQTAITNALEAFEATAAAMVATYTTRTKGMPVPERSNHFEEASI